MTHIGDLVSRKSCYPFLCRESILVVAASVASSFTLRTPAHTFCERKKNITKGINWLWFVWKMDLAFFKFLLTIIVIDNLRILQSSFCLCVFHQLQFIPWLRFWLGEVCWRVDGFASAEIRDRTKELDVLESLRGCQRRFNHLSRHSATQQDSPAASSLASHWDEIYFVGKAIYNVNRRVRAFTSLSLSSPYASLKSLWASALSGQFQL